MGDKALIIGDAAHAVVPFYGQGMNAGFEDCTLLDQLFQKYGDNLANVLAEFSDTRWQDTYAISDLAMYNYIEVSGVCIFVQHDSFCMFSIHIAAAYR